MVSLLVFFSLQRMRSRANIITFEIYKGTDTYQCSVNQPTAKTMFKNKITDANKSKRNSNIHDSKTSENRGINI